MGERAYAQRGDGIWTVLYMGSSTTIPLEHGKVRLVQTTQYPWDGAVEIRVEPEKSFVFDLNLLGNLPKLSGNFRRCVRKLAHLRGRHSQKHDGVTHPRRQIAHASLPKVLLRPF